MLQYMVQVDARPKRNMLFLFTNEKLNSRKINWIRLTISFCKLSYRILVELQV